MISHRQRKRLVKTNLKKNIGFRKEFLNSLLYRLKEYPNSRRLMRQAYNLFR